MAELYFNGPGSKPGALHTEYVEEEYNERAYGTQDLVFYLLRADSDEFGGGDDEQDFVYGNEDQQFYGGAEQAKDMFAYSNESPFGANGDTGFVPDYGNTQSGLNQVAQEELRKSFGTPGVGGYSLAPQSGLRYTDEEELGVFSQNASLSVDVGAAVRNAIKSIPDLDSQTVKLGLASSERMFGKILQRGFVPDETFEDKRDEDSILNAINRPNMSELAFLLARASGGMTRVKDVAAAVNDGTLGMVTPKSRAFQQRMGPNGAPKRR